MSVEASRIEALQTQLRTQEWHLHLAGHYEKLLREEIAMLRRHLTAEREANAILRESLNATIKALRSPE